MMILVNDVHYHVEETGQGDTLVLLHGFTGSGANWSEHVEFFAERFRVVTVDLLGHGQTDSPGEPERYRIEQAARDLAALFEQLKPGKVHLLGYSMGGRLALYTAIHYPAAVRSLILESASPGLDSMDERRARLEQDTRLAGRIKEEGVQKFVDDWERLPLWATQSDAIRARLRTQRLQNNPVGLANSLLGMGTGAQPSLWPHLPALSMRALLIAGALDPKFAGTARQMRDHIPLAELSIIPDAGHTTHLEQPEAFRQTVFNFLTQGREGAKAQSQSH